MKSVVFSICVLSLLIFEYGCMSSSDSGSSSDDDSTSSTSSSTVVATKIAGGTVDNTEFGYLDGIKSNIQTQLDNKKDAADFNSGISIGTTYYSQVAPTSGLIIEGNVGVGTTAPDSRLDIKSSTDDAEGGLKVRGLTGGRTVRLWVDGANETAHVSGGDGTVALVINGAGGDVGVGNTSPSAKLHITEETGIVTNPLTASEATIRIQRDNDYGGLALYDRDADAATTNDVDTVLYYADDSTDNLHLSHWRSGGTELRHDLTILGSNGNVGIGITAPAARLNVDESTGTVHGNAQGSVILDHEDNGGASSIVFRSRINRGSDYGYIQYQDDATVGGAGESARLIIGTSNDAADHIALMASGNVGVGTTDPNDALDVVGDIDATGCVQVADTTTIGGTCVSDARLKHDIRPLENSLEKVLQIRPVSYFWRDGFSDIHKRNGQEIGLLAQEVEAIFPEMVVEREDGFKAVKYDISLKLYLVQALKEFYTIFSSDKEEQNREIAALKEENKTLKRFLCEKHKDAPFCS